MLVVKFKVSAVQWGLIPSLIANCELRSCNCFCQCPDSIEKYDFSNLLVR